MPELPKFDAHDFKAGQPIDNPYFPLREGFTYHFAGKAQDDAGRLVPAPTMCASSTCTSRWTASTSWSSTTTSTSAD